MKINPTLVATGVLMALSCASFAQAQAPKPAAAAPTGTPPPQGPALPGVCVLSKEGAVYSSAAGKAMLARLAQLNSQAEAEIKGQQTTLQAKAQDLQRTAQIRQAEMRQTQDKALQTFGTYMDPIVRQVFTQRSCSIMIDGNSLVYPAPAMDVTPQVITGLNAKVQSFPFDREHIDPNQAAAPR